MVRRRRLPGFLTDIRKHLGCCAVCSTSLFIALGLPLLAKINLSTGFNESLRGLEQATQVCDGVPSSDELSRECGAKMLAALQNTQDAKPTQEDQNPKGLPKEETDPLKKLKGPPPSGSGGPSGSLVPGIPVPEETKNNKEADKPKVPEAQKPFFVEHWDDINAGYVIGLIAGVIAFNPIIGLMAGVLGAAFRHFHFQDKQW